MQTALTIAGSDSSGGAGIQADIKTMQALGVFAASAITAVTVQNTCKVFAIQEMRPEIVRDQILCLFQDMDIHAVKIGMVASTELIGAVAEALVQVQRPPVVLDPVMISKSGYPLLKEDACRSLIQRLLPLADIVTPNLHEAAALLGSAVNDLEQMKAAARAIVDLGPAAVVVKGGHLDAGRAADVFYDGKAFSILESTRFDTPNTHGTGCTFAAAIAAGLAKGRPMFQAVAEAKTYITGAIEHSLAIGKGHGPTNHFWHLYQRAGMDF